MVSIPGRENTQRKPEPLRKPVVVLQPEVYKNLQKGVGLIVNAVRPTLGPLPRLVAIEKFKGKELPELLDDGATIARRIIQIEPRGWDIGAMLVRQALWKMHQEVGDGTATLAVIYQAVLDEGIRYVLEFGYNAMLIRSGLEEGSQAVQEYLRQRAQPLLDKDAITAIARGMCHGDEELAEMLGELFDIVGAEGMIVIEGGNRYGLEREYVEGAYWDISGWFSRLFLPNPADKRVILEDAALLITDLALNDPNAMIPVLERCVAAGVKKLVIIAKELADSVTGLLVNNNRANTIQSVVVRTPRTQEMDRVANMEDIATLTGGRIYYAAAGDRLENFQVQDLGYARRAWAAESLFGLYGGKGDLKAVRQHISRLQGMLKQVNARLAPGENIAHEKEKLQKRLGRLLGGVAILRVGGISESEREARKEMAQRAVAALRLALQGGVAAGGGAALLEARLALANLPRPHAETEIAYRILARALEEPMRTIAKNAGYQPDLIIEKAKDAPPGCGLEARSGKIVVMRQSGVLDSARVLEKAVEIGVAGAAIALTTDIIVHHKKPKEAIEP